MRALRVTVLSMAVVCLLAGGARAAPAWLPADDLTTGVGKDPEVGMDANGNIVATWVGAGDVTQGPVHYGERPAAGIFGSPGDLTSPGTQTDLPVVVANARGDLLAAWTEYNGSHMQVFESYRPVGHAWQLATPLSHPAADALDVSAALNDAGAAIVGWSAAGEAEVTYRPAGSEAFELVKGFPGDEPGVAVDPAGLGVVVFDAGDRVKASVRSPVSGAWSDPVDISAVGGAGSFPKIAFDASGRGLAVYAQDGMVRAATRTTGDAGAFSGAFDLSSAGEQANSNPEMLSVAVGPQGQAAVTWSGGTTLPYRIRGVYRDGADGPFSAAEYLSAAGSPGAFNPDVGIDSAGNATAVWIRSNGSNYLTQTATHPAGGGWSQPLDLSAAGADAHRPHIAVNLQGDAVAVWDRGPNGSRKVQFAGYDGAGPQLRGLSVPASANPGDLLAFSVTPVDVWSALASTHWDFGDGGGADAPSASHAYGAPGTFSARVTSADVLGNSSTAGGDVVVAAPPPAGGSGTGNPPPTPTGSKLKLGACANSKRGTKAADRLTGTSAGDRLFGLGGKDVLRGLAGDDCLDGGSGNDRLDGGTGNDKLTGGAGADLLIGGKGKDSFSAGAGNDVIRARDGRAEHVDCGPGRDVVTADRADRLKRCERVKRH